MTDICLASQQKIDLELRHKKARNSKEADRIKSVLLRDEGWSVEMIAQALRKNETSIRRHLNEYLQQNKLTIDSGGSESRLNNEQTKALIEHLTEHTYYHNHQIVAYIKDTYGVQYTVAGLHKWLTRNGFVYKRPKGVPHKTDTHKQRAFVETYEQLKGSTPSNEPILFMDAVHPTQATKITSGWIRKGQDKIINTTGSRTRINLIGAIKLGCLEKTVTSQYQTVNAESIIDFLGQLRGQYSTCRQLHLILDGAGYHRAKAVKEEAKKLNIKLHYLPPYSPNLNPIERLWKVMNEHARNNRYFQNAKKFRQSIRHFFAETLPNIADSLNSRITDNFQIL